MGRAHIAAFTVTPGAEIVGVVSRSGERARELAAEFKIPNWGQDWRSVAEKARPHACVVAVSHLENESITSQVIEYGLHVLAEKPVALHSSVVQALAERAQVKKILAMAAMNRRFYPSVFAAIDLILFHGPILGVTAIAPDPVQPYRAQRLYPPEVYDHWMLMNTIHIVDLLRMVGGEVKSVIGDSNSIQSVGEQSTVAVLRFRAGILGSFIAHSGSSGHWELRIHGDGIEAILGPLEQGTIRIGNAAPRPLPSAREVNGLKPGLRQQSCAFVEAIRDLGYLPPPASSLTDHARTLSLVESLQQIECARSIPLSADVTSI